MPTDTPYSIADLARLADVTPRTVRYYVAQGLLAAPSATGRGPHYDEGHLQRLQLIRRLQRQHLPLAEIRARLAEMSDADVASAAETAPPAPTAGGSALDYIRSLLADATGVHSTVGARTAAAAPGFGSAPRALMQPTYAPQASMPSGVAESRPERPVLERSQWERLSLGPNIELHIRRPLSRHEQRRVERLITIAREVLKEGQP